MGVVPNKNTGRFGAKFVRGGKQIWLGTFDTRAEAQGAMDEVQAMYPPWKRYGGFQARLFLPGRTTDAHFVDALRYDPCAYCGAPAEEVDHIEPRAADGENAWDNYTGACASCNHRKSDAPLLAFLLQERLRAEIADLRETVRLLYGRQLVAVEELAA